MTKQSRQNANAESPAKAKDGEFSFQAKVARLLHLMVHSVYSEREIFLREIISNAADACDKLRYKAVTASKLLSGDPDLRITLKTDKDAGTLTIADNGIGMGRAELIDDLGTIARSGTRAFLDRITKGADDVSLIGQFGVGFYSAFMVADRVEVLSRKAGSKSVHIWSSDASSFTVELAGKSATKALERGTAVTLFLKGDAKEYLEESRLEKIVRAYSDHIAFPINLTVQKEAGEELRQLNAASAMWTRAKSELDERQYREFYRHASGLFDEPAITIHYNAEGRHEYTVLLFVPSMRPFDLFDPDRKGRVKLYVKRVLITDDADILPAYLRFVRGVIDSEDMPLNFSREMLQNNPIVAAIAKSVTSRVLDRIANLAEKDSEKFEQLWRAFGSVLKEGIYEDPERRDRLFEIARFHTSESDELRSLGQYVSGLRSNQTAIYYLIGDSLEQLRSSPQLEGYRGRGLEVLLLAHPVDNFWVTTAAGFDGKPFQSITQGEVDLSKIEPLETKEGDTALASSAILARIKGALADAVDDVKASNRLVESPACLVAAHGAPDRGMDKILQNQTGTAGRLPILEVNLAHPLVMAIDGKSANQTLFEDLAWLLLDEARILEGRAPADPAKFSARVNRLVIGALG